MEVHERGMGYEKGDDKWCEKFNWIIIELESPNFIFKI